MGGTVSEGGETPREPSLAQDRVGPRWGLLVCVAIVVAYGWGIFERDLWIPDEIRVGEIAREMYVNHAYTIPTLAGQPFLEKPPLYHWATCLSFATLGVTDGAVRLPAALFGLIGLLFSFRIARRLGGPRVGWIAVAVLSSSYAFVYHSHQALVDPALAAGVAMCLDAFLAIEALPRGERARGRIVWAGVTLAVGFYAKGVIGLVLPLAILGVWALLQRRLDLIWKAMPAALAIAIALLVPWFISLSRVGGSEALELVLWDNTLQRLLPFLGGDYSGGHSRPFWYYFEQLPGVLVPWSLLPIAAVLEHWRGRRSGGTVSRARSLGAVWFLVGFGLLSAAGTKRALYLLPLLGGSALYLAGWLEPILVGRRAPDRLETWLLRATVLALPIVIVAYGVHSWTQFGTIPAAGVLASLAILGAGLALATFGRSVAWGRVAACTFGLCLAIWATSGTALLPAQNGVESARPFAEAIERIVPKDAPLISFAPTEAMLAIVPFYTGRLPEVVFDIGEMQSRLNGPGPVWFVGIERLRDERAPYLLDWLAPARAWIVEKRWVNAGTYRLLLLRGGANQEPALRTAPEDETDSASHGPSDGPSR
ncbi:MAG: glycosyltransferase family 39 protein [Planctomycetota bacterium]